MSFPSQEIRLAADYRGIPLTEGMEHIPGRELAATHPTIGLPKTQFQVHEDVVGEVDVRLALDPDATYVMSSRELGITKRDGLVSKIGGIGLVKGILLRPVFPSRALSLSRGSIIGEVMAVSIEEQASSLVEAVGRDHLAQSYPGLREYADHSPRNTYISFFAESSSRPTEALGRLHFANANPEPLFVEMAREMYESGSTSDAQLFYEHVRTLGA